MRAAAWYQLGSWGSNDCPADSTRIVDINACQTAAAATGKVWRGVYDSDDYYPKGCYDYYETGGYYSVYFNNYEPSGSLSDDARPLCTGEKFLHIVKPNICV